MVCIALSTVPFPVCIYGWQYSTFIIQDLHIFLLSDDIFCLCSFQVKSICSSCPSSVSFSNFMCWFFGTWYLGFLAVARHAMQSLTFCRYLSASPAKKFLHWIASFLSRSDRYVVCRSVFLSEQLARLFGRPQRLNSAGWIAGQKPVWDFPAPSHFLLSTCSLGPLSSADQSPSLK